LNNSINASPSTILWSFMSKPGAMSTHLGAVTIRDNEGMSQKGAQELKPDGTPKPATSGA
jgi:hypothetical protein